MVAVGAFATRSTWVGLGQIAWHNGEVGHFVLVPLVMFWLIWVRRERLRHCVPTGRWIGPVMVAAGWALSAAGDAASIEMLVHAGGLSIMLGCLLAVLGLPVLRAFLPAFAVLLLVIPTPWTIHANLTIPLNKVVVRTSLTVYEAIGVPASWDGGILNIAGTSIPVLAVCDAPGLKAVLLVAYGFAFGQPLRSSVRVLILALVPVTALGFQLLGTTVIAGLAAMKQVDPMLLGVVAGWVLLPVVFAVLCGLVKLLHWAFVPVQPYSLAKDHS